MNEKKITKERKNWKIVLKWNSEGYWVGKRNSIEHIALFCSELTLSVGLSRDNQILRNIERQARLAASQGPRSGEMDPLGATKFRRWELDSVHWPATIARPVIKTDMKSWYRVLSSICDSRLYLLLVKWRSHPSVSLLLSPSPPDLKSLWYRHQNSHVAFK